MIRIITDNMLYMGVASAIFSLLLLLITWLSRNRLSSKLYLAGWTIALAILLVPAYALFVATSTQIPSKLTLNNRSIPVASYRDAYTNNMDQSVLYMLGVDRSTHPIENPRTDSLTADGEAEENVIDEASASVEGDIANIAATVTESETPAIVADTRFASDNGVSLLTLREILFVIWIFGVASIGVWKSVAYFRFKREMIRRSRPFDRLWEDLIPSKSVKGFRVHEARIASPIVFGVFRPIIFIPDSPQSEENIRYALMHERLHVLRKDLLLKTIAEIGAVLNFFNPFAWLIRNKVARYSEVSCDEAVAILLSEEERKGYALSILDYMEKASVPEQKYPAPLMSFSGKPGDVKGRIKHIMEFKKMRRPVAVISSCTILLAMMVGLVTACSLAFSGKNQDTDSLETNATAASTADVTDTTTEPTASIPSDGIELSDFSIAPTFYLATMFSDYGYAIVQDSDSNQYFFIDESGQQVGDITFDRYLTNGFRIWKAYGEFGVNGYLWIHYNGYWGFVNQDCELVVEPIYQDVMSFGSNGLAGVCVDHKWGFINESGEMVIEPQFDEVGTFSADGLCEIGSDGKYGFIDASGKVLAEPIYDAVIFDGGFYDWMGPFSDNGEGLVAVCSADKWGLLSTNGEVLSLPIYDSFFSFASNSLAVVYRDEKYGYIDAKGSEVIPCENASAYDFGDNGLAVVCKDDTFGYIDSSGEYVLQQQYDGAGNFSDNGLAAVMLDGVWGYIDEQGEYRIEPKYECAYEFSDSGYAVVYVDEKCGVINETGEYVISPSYGILYEIEGTDSPVFAVMEDDKWGLMDASEEYILEPNYTYLTFPRPDSDEGYDLINHSAISAALIVIDGSSADEPYFGIASSDGTILLPACAEYAGLAIAKNGMVAVEYNGKYGYVQLPGAS